MHKFGGNKKKGRKLWNKLSEMFFLLSLLASMQCILFFVAIAAERWASTYVAGKVMQGEYFNGDDHYSSVVDTWFNKLWGSWLVGSTTTIIIWHATLTRSTKVLILSLRSVDNMCLCFGILQDCDFDIDFICLVSIKKTPNRSLWPKAIREYVLPKRLLIQVY